MEIKTDVLIIGSGVAGLFSAIKAARFADVLIVTKKDKKESNTNYAQGGIASVLSPEDSYREHIADTMDAGAGLNNKDVVELLVREGPQRIKELVELGTEFTTKDGELDLVKEGGHSHRRIVHAKDLTGKEVEKSLIDAANRSDNIRIMENALAIDLITEHNVQNLRHLPINSRHCYGAYVWDIESKTVIKIIAKATILATGGLGQVYLHTTNPVIATGDGFAMAYRAGAKIANMEFVQFHPTAFYNPVKEREDHRSFLITEAMRGFGAKLIAMNGDSFMEKYDERKELAPRDIVARAIDTELKKRGNDYVYLDVTHKKKSHIIDHFPNIYSKLLEYGIDITTDYIPVVPAAHYACGGVIADTYSRSSLKGLYAVGEVTMTGVHGANRLASNSLLEALVFAERAAVDLKKNLENFNDPIPVIPDWDDSGTLSAEEKVLISHSVKELQNLMWDYVGIVRSNLRLTYAARRIQNLYEEVEEFYKKTKVFSSLIELRNQITCAHLIVKCSIQRKENIGLFYSLDYSEVDEWAEPENTVIQNTYQKS